MKKDLYFYFKKMKFKALTLILLCPISLLFGQFENREIITSDNSTAISKVLTPDLDGDGDLDVVFYSFAKSRLCFIENTFPDEYLKPSRVLVEGVEDLTYFLCLNQAGRSLLRWDSPVAIGIWMPLVLD